MSVDQFRSIRTAIREALTGAIGGVRIVPMGMFEGGVTAGSSIPEQQAKALDHRYEHRFDVSFLRQSSNASTPQSIKASYRIVDLTIAIDTWTKLKSEVLNEAREEVRASILGDANTAIEALSYASNLETTGDGYETGIVSGLIHGPDGAATPTWELVEENWQQKLLRSRLTGVATVVLVQPVAA